ncbi:unnamed protein product [Phyllotreta striolata]|uniref:Peptidase S1 domain-containing protein n=1 Tax=Phyllotreta striolata TaxID=444603 RepID=A0A9N9XTI2_PHYSR|nr:unnamed protein product [Phyllotreta striolata]
MLKSIAFSLAILVCLAFAEKNYKNYAKHGVCGKSFVMSLRIIGGERAKRAEFPWMVSIMRRGNHFCGGSIISERFVLTAAHCFCSGLDDDDFYSPRSVKLRIGHHKLAEEMREGFTAHVKSIVIHSGYKCNVAKDDIALVVLEKDLAWSATVAPVCVSRTKDELTGGGHVTVAGWGWTSQDFATGERSNALRKARLRMIDLDDCRSWYKAEKKSLKILNSHLCAGYKSGGIDACWADSGGPLMKPVGSSTDQMMIVGIVSTGRGCGLANLPGIYTMVSHYIPWIDGVMETFPNK